jgi:hypothetical protein
VIVIPKVTKMKEQEVQIKESICSLLNGRGGIILFDCLEIGL